MKYGGIRQFLLSVTLVVCVSHPAPAQLPETPLTTVRVASGLERPLYVTHAPGDHARIFIVEQFGRIRILKGGDLLATPFLNIESIVSGSDERGLLGLAFDPNYASNGKFFVNYTDENGAITVARYTVSGNPDIANPSGEIILLIPHPSSRHNGGWIDFGPDGFLYIATGDGDGGNIENGQSIVGELLGNILRIDVDGDDYPADALRNYAIPPDNPFVGITGEDEIWAYGLRNPWRCAFDSELGDLYIGDVGEHDREEIDFQPASSSGGANYGWSCLEGTFCISFGVCDCESLDWTPPIHEYDHTVGCAVTGGEVYRGCAIPDLQGTYFFADLCSANIWNFRVDGGVATDVRNRTAELDPGNGLKLNWISSFGRDADSEIYICDLFDGAVFKIVPKPPLTVTETNPPDGAIDARRHIGSDGVTPVGWSQVAYTFNNPAHCTTADSFATSQTGGVLDAPGISAVVAGGNNKAIILLNRVIESQAWTAIYHGESRSTIRIAALPADVNADGTNNTSDIKTLLSALRGEIPTLPIWSSDIDRSGVTTPRDILSAINLLTGALGGEALLGATLP